MLADVAYRFFLKSSPPRPTDVLPFLARTESMSLITSDIIVLTRVHFIADNHCQQ